MIFNFLPALWIRSLIWTVFVEVQPFHLFYSLCCMTGALGTTGTSKDLNILSQGWWWWEGLFQCTLAGLYHGCWIGRLARLYCSNEWQLFQGSHTVQYRYSLLNVSYVSLSRFFMGKCTLIRGERHNFPTSNRLWNMLEYVCLRVRAAQLNANQHANVSTNSLFSQCIYCPQQNSHVPPPHARAHTHIHTHAQRYCTVRIGVKC